MLFLIGTFLLLAGYAVCGRARSLIRATSEARTSLERLRGEALVIEGEFTRLRGRLRRDRRRAAAHWAAGAALFGTGVLVLVAARLGSPTQP